MGGIVKSVVEKARQDGTKYWVTVIEGEGEVLAYDSQVVGLEGKPCPFEIGTGQKGGKYIKFPKAGGFQKGGAGGWKGKSDKEIYTSIFTMCMAYAEHLVVPQITSDNTSQWIQDTTLKYYRAFSQTILADLKAIEGEAPKQEVPKVAEKPPTSVPQETSAPKPKYVPPPEGVELPIKKKLEKAMWAYLTNLHSDSDNNFKALLIEITSFPDKDKDTGELTGKTKFCDDWERLSDGWAKTAYGKLKKMIEEEERKAIAESPDMEDVRY